MRRHFHGPRSGHSDRGCVGAVPISHGPTEVSFSAAFCAAVHPGVIVGLKAKGFTCDVDLRYLTVEDLTSGMQGFLDEEEAASLIELSQVTVRIMPNRSSSGSICVASSPSDNTARASSPAFFSESQVAISASAPKRRCLSQVAPVDFFWDIYIRLGIRGLLWSPLAASNPDAARVGFERRFQNFELKSLKAKISMLRRWWRFLEAQQAPQSNAVLPVVQPCFQFLQAVAASGPTAAPGVFQNMLWWRRHVGIPWPTEDPLLCTWNRVLEPHAPKERTPLSFKAYSVLVDLTSKPPAAVASFAAFALLPLVACLRFAHVQRSVGLAVDGEYVVGLCVKGKSRRKGGRPPFRWAAPAHFAGRNNVFDPMLRVVQQLQSQHGTLPFVIPDLALGPSGVVDGDAKWCQRPMPIEKFISLLRSLLGCRNVDRDEIESITTYSLRRFLPTIAEVLLTPPFVSQALGNWQEIPTQSHVDPVALSMVQHYAHDKVASAGYVKGLLLSAVQKAQQACPGEKIVWQTFRKCGITWQSLVPSEFQEERGRDASTSLDESSSESSSSSSSNASDASAARRVCQTINWMSVQPAVVHILQDGGAAFIPWCRTTPFVSANVKWGTGLQPGSNVCAKCIHRVPPSLLQAIRKALAQTDG